MGYAHNGSKCSNSRVDGIFLLSDSPCISAGHSGRKRPTDIYTSTMLLEQSDSTHRQLEICVGMVLIA